MMSKSKTKRTAVILFFVISIVITVGIVFSLLRQIQSEIKDMESEIGISIPSANSASLESEKGWFGEGTTYNLYGFSDENAQILLEEISRSGRFNRLPFDKTLWEIAANYNVEIPNASNGYYLYRYKENKDSNGYVYGMDLTLIVYDIEEGELHYIEHNH